MKSVRLQLLVAIVTATVAVGWLAYRGLPPEMDLLSATRDGDLNMMRRCLMWRDDVDERTAIQGLYLRDPPDFYRLLDSGSTALHIAAWRGQTDAIGLLLSHGCTVNAESQHGFTPLHLAAEGGSEDVVAALLDAGAAIEARSSGDETPLARAVVFGRSGVIDLLAARGADLNAHIGLRGTALHVAATRGDRVEAAKSLIDHGADLNARDGAGDAPLHRASQLADARIVELLLARGADVKAKGQDGKTPLHVAAEMLARTNPVRSGVSVSPRRNALKSIVSMLLEAGSDPNVRDGEGQTMLMTAVWWYADRELVEWLVAQGADVNAADTEGRTPLSVASRQGQKDVAALLREHGAVD